MSSGRLALLMAAWFMAGFASGLSAISLVDLYERWRRKNRRKRK